MLAGLLLSTALARLELWRVPVGHAESEWRCLAAADLRAAQDACAAAPCAEPAGDAAAPCAEPAGGAAARRAPEGMGDIEDCPWHVSAPAHWEMYEYRMANADPEL